MKPYVPSIRDVEIMKAALEGDIIYQKKQITKLGYQGRDTVPFEDWLKDSEELLQRTNTYLSKLKAGMQVE